MRAVEVNRIDIFFELQQYRNVRDRWEKVFLYAYFLYAQEIGERKPHNARRGFLIYKGEAFPRLANVRFAATDKR